jgi:uncharacterized membrane protein
MRKNVGIALIYLAAVLIMLSILFLFDVIPFRFAYTTAAAGFTCYVVGMFFSREGRSPYKIAMILVGVILILVAVVREIA